MNFRGTTSAGLVMALALAVAGCSGSPAASPAPAGPISSRPVSSGPASSSPAAPGAGRLAPAPLTVARGGDAGAARGRSLDLPPGWTAQVWAQVPHARMAVWTPDDRLLVTTGDRGVLASVTARGVTTVLDGLDNPQGVALTEVAGRTVLVVGEETRLVAWNYAHGTVTGRRVILDGLPGGGHGGKFVAVRDGVVFYDVGSATNRDPVDRTARPERATIARVGLDGSGARTLAVGVRNGEGLSIAPDGTLFAAINQGDNQPYPFRDDTGRYGELVRAYVDEHPNDQISRITPGTDLGWPYCVPDSRGHADLRDLGYVNDPLTNADGENLDCRAITRTQLGLPAHSAPVGFVFTPGSALPGDLREGALITAHGSWNRRSPREPYVAYSRWDAGTGTLRPATMLVRGFQEADGHRWGRSVDAVPGPDGSIYLTDDLAGLVYRLTPPG
jgi:glucose/arabinose dehydrogenase